MSTQLLSHPFLIKSNGTAKTVTAGSTAANAEAIAVLAQTIRGERPMAPAFGITDPTFQGLDAGEIQAGLSAFGPDGVIIASVKSEPRTDTTTTVTIAFIDNEGASRG